MSEIRFFADSPVALKPIAAALKNADPNFKIDGGEIMRGGPVLAEIEVTSAGSDMFGEDIQYQVQRLQQVGGPAAQHVMQRMQRVQSIVLVRLIDPNAWDQIGPLWTALAQASTGLTHVAGQGFYDGQQLVVQLP